jgi:hypothetical protein
MRFATVLVIVFINVFLTWAPDALAEDEIYRWVDENGAVHFGDRPPENGAAESISIPQSSGVSAQTPANSSSNDVEEAGEPQPSLAQQLREERAENRRKKEERDKIVTAACEQRRTLVSQLEPSTRVMVQLEDGTVTRMDDNVRLETLNEAKSYIAENCTN